MICLHRKYILCSQDNWIEVKMLRKILKTGNSIVVSLPKDAMAYPHIQEGSQVNIELNRENVRS
jgi:hypothetical protein